MTIPTSLIVVLLVLAWLVVLVPMAARRRERVPQVDDRSGRLRVLRGNSRRRRPRLRRSAAAAGRAEQEGRAQVPENHDETDDQMAVATAGDGTSAGEPVDAAQEWEHVHPVAVRRKPLRVGASTGDYRDGEAEDYDEAGDGEAGAGEADEAGANEADDAGAVQQPDDGPGGADRTHPERSGGSRPRPDRDDGPLSDGEYRRRRSGRGGFDPEAAEAARAFRFAQRRRVALILASLTVLGVVAAVLASPMLWIPAVIVALALTGYLVNLRRQVKIEREINRRRTARLARARQIRPEAGQQPEDLTQPIQRVRPVSARPDEQRGIPVASVPPVQHRRGRVALELDDDDPSFDDLENYQPTQYRRAAGE